jgi:hypothetical protein
MRKRVMRTATLVLGGCVAAALAFLILSIRADAREGDEPGRVAPRSEARGEAAAPRRASPAPSQPKLPRLAGSVPTATTADDQAVPHDPRELEQVLAAQRIEREQERERLVARLRGETRDPSWASGVEQAVTDSIRALDPDQASIESVECRSRTCAIVMSHPNSDAQSRAMNDLAGKPGFRSAGRAHLEFGTGIETRTYVFLARDAKRFPAN